MPKAARLTDPIEHSHAFEGLLAGAAVGLAVALIIGSGGTAVVALAALGCGVVTGAGIGEVVGSLSRWGGTVTGGVSSGSLDTTTNSLPAARATYDTLVCSGTPPSLLSPTHEGKHVAEGSSTVSINGQPAARADDRVECGAKIAAGSPDVIIGGAKLQTLDIDSEVPGEVHQILFVVGLASAVVLAGPVVALLGLGGSILGGDAMSALGGEIFGEGSDRQKIMGLAGSLVGGGLAMKGGVRPARYLGSKVKGPVGNFLARGDKLPPRKHGSSKGTAATPKQKSAVEEYIASTKKGGDFKSPNAEEPALYSGPKAADAAHSDGLSLLEDTPTGKAATELSDSLGKDVHWADKKPMWDASSEGYAHEIGRSYGTVDPITGEPLNGPNAGKPVNAYVSDAANPGSTYYNTEAPILESYGVNVNEVHISTKSPPVYPGVWGPDDD